MVPLIRATKVEFDLIKERIDATAQSVMKETGTKSLSGRHHVEPPRACLMRRLDRTSRESLVRHHDLTQTTYGITARRRGFPRPRHREGDSGATVHLSVDRDGVGELGRSRPARGPQDPPHIKGRESSIMARSLFRRVSATRLASNVSWSPTAFPIAAAGRRASRALHDRCPPGVDFPLARVLVIPGWSRRPDPNVSIAHRGISRVPGSRLDAPRNDIEKIAPAQISSSSSLTDIYHFVSMLFTRFDVTASHAS